MQSSPVPWYLLPLNLQHLPQHPIIPTLQPILFPERDRPHCTTLNKTRKITCLTPCQKVPPEKPNHSLKIHFNSTLPSTPWSSKWSLSSKVSSPNPCKHISRLPSVPHALPISKTTVLYFKRLVWFRQRKHPLHHHHHHHHHIYVTELGHLLTRSGLTYPEVSSKVYHDSFCQLDSSVSLPWVIHFEAFHLYVVSSSSCIPVIFPKLVLFLRGSDA